jgi:hypothetical protein
VSNQYKISVAVCQSPVAGLWEIYVEGILLETMSSEAAAKHSADTYGSFPHDIIKDMNQILANMAKRGEVLRRERFIDDRDFQLMRHYQDMADLANAALRVSLLTRNVK